jgi:hypothetical protein
MRYKIVVTTPELSTAKKIHALLCDSKIYKGKEIITLSAITEVCDECAKKVI